MFNPYIVAYITTAQIALLVLIAIITWRINLNEKYNTLIQKFDLVDNQIKFKASVDSSKELLKSVYSPEGNLHLSSCYYDYDDEDLEDLPRAFDITETKLCTFITYVDRYKKVVIGKFTVFEFETTTLKQFLQWLEDVVHPDSINSNFYKELISEIGPKFKGGFELYQNPNLGEEKS